MGGTALAQAFYMRMFWLAILTTASFAASAVDSTDDCSAKLVRAQDRLLGAVRTCLGSRTMTRAQLAQMVTSPTPVNPYSTQTPGSANSSARRLFDSLLAEPGIRDRWSVVVHSLQPILNEMDGHEARREDATRATAKVLAPSLAIKLNKLSNGGSFAMTQLPSGEDVVAYVNEDDRLRVVRIEDQHELLKQKLWGLNFYRMAWVHDGAQTWLYMTANNLSGEGVPSTYFFRLKWGETEPKRIKAAADIPADTSIMSLRVLSPKVVLGKGNAGGLPGQANAARPILVNLAGDEVVKMNWNTRGDQSIAMTDDGHVITPKQRDGASAVVYRTSSGKVLKAVYETTHEISVYDAITDDLERTIPYANTSAIEAMKFSEWNGKVLLAVSESHLGNNLTSVIDVFSADHTPLVTKDVSPSLPDKLNWFTDPHGFPLLGVDIIRDSKTYLSVLDPIHNSTSEFEIPAMSGGRQVNPGQTYFWYPIDNGIERAIHIYRLFNKVGG